MKNLKENNEVEDGDMMKLQNLKGGTATKISIGEKRKRDEVHVTSETVAKAKKVLKLSDRETDKLCGILREGNLKVEQNTKKFLSEVDNLLLPFYEGEENEDEGKSDKGSDENGEGEGRQAGEEKGEDN